MKFWKKQKLNDNASDEKLDEVMRSFELIDKACAVFTQMNKNFRAIGNHFNKFVIPNLKNGEKTLKVARELIDNIEEKQLETLKKFDTRINGIDAKDIEFI